MKKTRFFLLMLCFLFSCKNEKEKEFVYINLVDTFTLNALEVLYSFDDKFPIGVSVRDSIAYIIQIKSDTNLIALNLNTQQIIQLFGTSGYGPGDIISPNFISSINNLDVLLQDGFAKKFNKIDVNKQTNRFEIKKYMDYSDKIFRSGETNISKNFIAGRKVGDGKMFYIYDRNTDVVIDLDYFPVIKNLNRNIDFNHIYAPSIALNEEKNRVFAGMYFYDMFHIYDLSGNRIKTCCFSKNAIPSFSSNDLMENILQKCNEGIIRSFPTKEYCYFLRIKRDRVENMLIQVNWDGELVNAYNIPDEVLGQFYIDENEKKLFIIRHLVSDRYISEVFEIVSYSLKI